MRLCAQNFRQSGRVNCVVKILFPKQTVTLYRASDDALKKKSIVKIV